jgi:hypothetical protein
MSSSIIDTRSSLKPIFEAKPDMRFATTFISNKYRDYAVKGEVLMDKVTGEIFTKRKEDGRVVSFYQNKKYLHDLMFELRLLLNNNVDFRYPGVDNVNAFYVSTDYDVMSLYDNKDTNIVNNNIVVPNDEQSVHQVQFAISKECNGFFMRVTSRDADKAIIEWLTNQYNALFKNYTGDNETFRAEAHKFEDIEKWEDSNAVVNYTLYIKRGTASQSFDLVDYIRINEESCVKFPSNIEADLISEADDVSIRINSITFDKIHFMFEYQAALPVEIIDGIQKFIYPDNAIYTRYINICSFVDDSTDIELLGNEFIIAMVDMPYCVRYMSKLATLTNDPSYLLSVTRPTDDVWKVNGVWAEQVRDVFKGGYEIDFHSEIDLKALESYLASNDDTDYVSIVTDVTDERNMYANLKQKSY